MVFLRGITLLAALSCALLNAAEIEERAPNPSSMRIVSVDPTPEPDHVKLYIVFPKEGDIKTGQPVKVQTRLNGFPLGTYSEFPRAREIANDNSKGQSLHVFVDNEPYFIINEAIIDALDDNEEYYEQTSNFAIPFDLKPGMHVLRIFPARSFYESIKGDKACAVTTFYYKVKKDNLDVDLDGAYLTYNEPDGEYQKGKPILLDFYIANCQLSKDGYKVRFSIDGKMQRILTQWIPYYIYGLQQGKHAIRLELLDPQNKLVPGLFNDVTRNITIR